MKKFVICLLSCILCLIPLALAGCGDSPNEESLEECPIGYMVEPYPSFPFDYSMQWNETEYLIHIDSITITLIEKNIINEGDIVSGEFFPYTFHVVVRAYTAATLADRSISVRLLRNDSLTMLKSNVKNTGEIEWTQIWHTMSIPQVSFSDIILYD